MLVTGVPVFDPGDAEIYGWRITPDADGNLWLRVIDRDAYICFRPGTHITHAGGGNMRGNVKVEGLEGSIDPDGNAWMSAGGVVTPDQVALTPDIRAIIFAPGGFLRFEDGQLHHQGIEFAGQMKAGPSEPGQ